MEKQIKLLGFSGSYRKGSYNTKLLHAAAKILPENVQMEIISIADIPFYNGDMDIPAADRRPREVEIFREKMAAADGLVIASPEYNHSIPGGLKNAIDWASRGSDSPIIGKVVSIMGATQGMWGALRMQISFHPIVHALSMQRINKFEIMMSHAKQKFDDSGNLVDESTKELIVKHLQELKDHIIKNQ